METAFSWTSGGYAGSATGATTYNAAPAGASGNGAVSGGQLGVYFAFIQFAGFTMGKEKCIAARIPLPDIGIDCVHDFGRSILSPLNRGLFYLSRVVPWAAAFSSEARLPARRGSGYRFA
jgi:hypothetical protein